VLAKTGPRSRKWDTYAETETRLSTIWAATTVVAAAGTYTDARTDRKDGIVGKTGFTEGCPAIAVLFPEPSTTIRSKRALEASAIVMVTLPAVTATWAPGDPDHPGGDGDRHVW